MTSNNNPFSIKDKHFLITGASSGIGRATAIECSKLGATLTITGRNTERLNQTLSMMQGNQHHSIIADLTSEDDRNKLIDELQIIDGLVNCAGVSDPLPFQFVSEKSIDFMMDNNFKAPTLLTQGIIKKKKLKRNSSIVFISSLSGVYLSMVGGALYSASKGAINGLIKGMALDLAPNYRVNSICPGIIETPILEDGLFIEGQLDMYRQKTPLKRNGYPEEVAYTAIYLLSDATKWMTGTNIIIDGGYMLN